MTGRADLYRLPRAREATQTRGNHQRPERTAWSSPSTASCGPSSSSSTSSPARARRPSCGPNSKERHERQGRRPDVPTPESRSETTTVDKRTMQYLYQDGTDSSSWTSTYDHLVSSEVVGSATDYMLEPGRHRRPHEGVPLYIGSRVGCPRDHLHRAGRPGRPGPPVAPSRPRAVDGCLDRSRSSSRPARGPKVDPRDGSLPRPGQLGPRSTWARARKGARAALDLLFEARTSGLQRCRPARRQARPRPAGSGHPASTPRRWSAVSSSRWTAINDALTTYSHRWTLDRMPAVDRSSAAAQGVQCSSATRCPPRWRCQEADLPWPKGPQHGRLGVPLSSRLLARLDEPNPPWSDRRRACAVRPRQARPESIPGTAYLVLVLCNVTAGAHG